MKYSIAKTAATATPVRLADCSFNRIQIANTIISLARANVETAYFPALCITGATCRDLFYHATLIDEAYEALIFIANATREYGILSFVGLPYKYKNSLYSCIAVIFKGNILGIMPQEVDGENLRYFSNWDKENIIFNVDDTNVLFGTKLLFASTENKSFLASAVNSVKSSLLTSHANAGATVLGVCCSEYETAYSEGRRKLLATSKSDELICAIAVACAGEGESTTDAAYSGHCIVTQGGSVNAQTLPFTKGYAIYDIDTELDTVKRIKNRFILNDIGYDIVNVSFSAKNTLPTTPLKKNPFLPINENELSEFCNKVKSICAHALAKRLAHTQAQTAVIGISGGLDSCLALIITVKAFTLLKLPLEQITAISMPCFGTSNQTKNNAELLCRALNVNLKEIDIKNSVISHFNDIEQSQDNLDITYENAQARIRTLVLMDIANKHNGIVVGTGDLSELALGWATYGGDHMSMYSVNSGVPKTVVQEIIRQAALDSDNLLCEALNAILQTPISPELLPSGNNEISQVTEEIVGPYALHDFFIYYIVGFGYSPKKVFTLAVSAFNGCYSIEIIYKWLDNFYKRFFSQQFKRSCMPDGPQVFDISLSPRTGLFMPSDAVADAWLRELALIKERL